MARLLILTLIIVFITPVPRSSWAQTESVEQAEVNTAPDPDTLRFDIWEFRIEGNSILDTREVERTVYPFLGPDKSIQDVEQARKTLEGIYQERGYGTIIVNIPEQDARSGIIRLQVTEGKVDRMRITGSHYFSLGRIRARVPALAPGQVPYLPLVQEELAALNNATPDRRIIPVMRPGRTPGTVEVELKVKDELPLHGSLEINNRNSSSTTSLRTTANLRYDNLWQKEHSLSLMYQVAPEKRDDVEVFSGTYVLRIPDSNNALALYVVSSKSDIATAGDIAVIGDGTTVGTRFVMPCSREKLFSQPDAGA